MHTAFAECPYISTARVGMWVCLKQVLLAVTGLALRAEKQCFWPAAIVANMTSSTGGVLAL
jgi:hypothetical protein